MAGAAGFFPLFIDLSEKKVLVVGGGKIAQRRVLTLLPFGASVTVISPDVTEPLAHLARAGGVKWLERVYERGDIGLASPFLVIAATNRRDVNHSVTREAQEREILAIISDCREQCSAYFPAIAEVGEYTIGLVSKTGNHKGVKEMAKRIREWPNVE